MHTDAWFSANGSPRLFENRWLPEHPRASLVLVHGINEHSGRYAETARGLADRGYGVWAFDLRGHGRSDGARSYVDSFEQFVDDLSAFIKHVQSHAPDLPCFVLGHSMGGAIVARLATTRHPDVQGIILSAPAVQVGDAVFPLLRQLARIASRLFPRLRLVRLGCSRLSRDQNVVADFRDDPLVFHGRISTRIGAEILNAADQLQQTAANLTLPVLLLHGTADSVTDPAGSQAFVAGASSEDKMVKIYGGLYHDLLHEPEKEQVLADLIDWLEARVFVSR